MDAAEGRLISITGRVEMPSIQDTALVITQEQALSKGRSLLLQKGNRLVGDIAAQLAYTCSSNGWTAKSYKEITYTLPYHLIWRVESSTQDEYGGSPGICAVGLDATTGEITGYGATLFRGGQSVVAYINGGEMGTFLRQASQLILTPLSPSVSKTTRRLTAFEGKRPNESKMLIAASDARKFYGALSGLIRALKFPKPLVFRATHQLTVSLRSGEKRILLFDRVTGYMKYQQRGETLYYLPGSALKKWMTS